MSDDPGAARRIFWSNEAIPALALLPSAARRALLDRLDLVAQYPAMYPIRQRGRFAGFRYFVVAGRWIVYYQPGEEIVTVFDILRALAPE